MTAWLLCDWGTSNVRAWVVEEDGTQRASFQAPLGVGKLEAGQAQSAFFDQIVPALDANQLPAMLSGMIGSTLGWAVVPYTACPATLGSLAEGATKISDRVWIAPGLVNHHPQRGPDVMRGEETQIFGWLAEVPERAEGKHVLCLPGTHSKWVSVVDGQIIDFMTVMTGELFDLLGTHSILAPPATLQPEWNETAFVEASVYGRNAPGLGAALFSTRARVVTNQQDFASTQSWLSGILVGAEFAAGSKFAPDAACVHLIGDRALTAHYERAFRHAGVSTTQTDGAEAARCGLLALAQRMS